MSAAQKLEALGVAIRSGKDPEWVEANGKVVRALPQIVAVVEAAEQYPFEPFSLDKLRLALSALDEALG